MKITIGGNTFEGDNIEINGSRVKKGEILSMQANIDGVDVEFGRNIYTNHPEYDRGFKAGQQSKQAEIDELKNNIQTALNRACMLQNSSGERIYAELKELLK